MRHLILLLLLATSCFASAQESCVFEADIAIETASWGDEVSWNLIDASGAVIFSGSNYSSNSSYLTTACLNDSCYTLELIDSFGDGWNGASISVNYADLGIMIGPLTMDQGDYASFSVGTSAACNGALIDGNGLNNDQYGCMDTGALNFDTTATVNCCCQYPEDCSTSNTLTIIQTSGASEPWCDSLWWGPVAELWIFDNNSTWSPSFQGANDQGQWIMEGCISDGCYNVLAYNSNCSGSGTLEFLVNGALQVGYGVTDSTSTSFALGINQDGCGFSIYGCTDPEAPNYNADADTDDGSCLEPCDCPDGFDPVCGYEYSTGLTMTFNNMCELECAGAYFQWEGDCSTPPIYGCLDADALNYNPNATADSGGCIYLPECGDGQAITVSSTMDTLDPIGGIFGNALSAYFTGPNGFINSFITYYGDDGSYASYGCLEDGCYNFHVVSNGWTTGGSIDVSINSGDPVTYILGADAYEGVFAFGVNEEDCEVYFPGCTDPEAQNYNPSATEDDGSCQYPFYCPDSLITAQLYVCTFSGGDEVSLTISDSQGNIIYLQDGYPDLTIDYIDVCLDPTECYTATMMNLAGGDSWNGGYFWIQTSGMEWVNGSLQGASEQSIEFGTGEDCGDDINTTVWGCTDPNALNFDPLATIDDGSCEYDGTDPVDPIDCDGDNFVSGLYFAGDAFISEVSWAILDSLGNVMLQGNGGSPNGIGDAYSQGCIPDGCYTIELYDSFGDGWGGGLLIITSDDVLALTFTLEEGEYASFPLELGSGCGGSPLTIWGCTDPGASNYDTDATAEDGSCEYASCPLLEVNIVTYTLSNGDEIGWTIEGASEEDSIWVNSMPMGDFEVQTHTLCLAAGCYTMTLQDSAEDDWNQGWVEVWMDGALMTTATYDADGTNSMNMGIGLDCGDAPGVAGGNTNAGMSGWDATVDFSIYPTPTGEIVNILGDGFDHELPVVVRIKDMMGKLVTERTVLPGEGKVAWQFDVRDWPAGIYTAEGTQGNTVAVGKVLVAR
ncbi:MAG TPA: hypothetical protein DHV07_05740 [Flavobacteriales bacterium]|nr:hypothetical protein [Flavobacteriales bacterium]